ncbi:hypothetical protein D8674_034534 [Pyrus ussuriensis x Pyrus communis]|uniref:MORF/ORRM1/DAG-like MORF domain-containing protein n=1 Tax=Pyrus ussuriensis x Pyrus communis TaxID=2448454 RepID=A0A5N5HP86_9ROSA|nr:hypothetical protein D8674_034534 [Pyrus ussuriensis x Pyrus communis]
MALSSLRLRRTISGLSTLHRSLSATSALSAPHSFSSPLLPASTSEKFPALPPQSWRLLLQSRTFRSSPFSSARQNSYGNNQNDEIGPDTILFEGCDYNHWLIVMDYPRDNKPPAEEMIRNYEEICAKGLNISVEEAKKKIYACSTTTYTGFQVVMSEEESQKFEGLPGVVFVLPDSYIDPQNKEYGGDKYINGTIIPRPPPVQYGRQQGGRFRDNNRNRDQQRYDQQRPSYNPQGNPSYNQQGPMRGGGNYAASQNYSSPRQGENTGPIPVNTAGGRDAYQPGGEPVPSYQGNYNQGGQQSYRPQEQRNFPQGHQRNYAPPGQQGFRGDNWNYGPPHSATDGQALSGFQGQGTPGAYVQGPSSGTYEQQPSSGAYGQGPSSAAYGQGPSSAAYGQGPSSAAYGQGPSSGSYGQVPSSGPYGQGTASGNGQGYPAHGGDERFQQSNSAPMEHTGIDQGKNY